MHPEEAQEKDDKECDSVLCDTPDDYILRLPRASGRLRCSGCALDSSPVAENQPPIAEARGSYKPTPSEKSIEITVGDTAYFDANMSKDTDGAIVEYIWDYGDGTFGEGFFTDHTYTSPGVYYVLLRVRDDKGAMSLLPSVVRVIVNPPLEVAPEVMRPVYEIAITTSLAPYVTTTTGDVTTTAFSDSTSTTYPGTTSSTELSSTSTSSALPTSTTSTTSTTTTTTLPVQVLIAAIKSNMKNPTLIPRYPPSKPR